MELNNTNTTRDKSFDIAKGIAMLAAIIGHCSVPFFMSNFVYIFHLPLFFIISGYFLKTDTKFIPFLKKKAYSLLIPYVCFALIVLVYYIIKDNIYALRDNVPFNYMMIFKVLHNFTIQKRSTTLWFLTVLFLGEIFFWVIDRLFKKDILKFIACVSLSLLFITYDMYINKPLLWNIDTAFVVLIFIWFGNWLKTKDIFNRYFLTKEEKIQFSFLFIGVGIIFTELNELLGYEPFDLYWNHFGIVPLTIGAAIFVSLGIILFCKTITNAKILSLIGKNTMLIFGFHQTIFLSVFHGIILFIPYHFNSSIEITILPLLEILWILLSSLIVGRFIKRCNLGFILGKKKKPKEQIA